MLYEDHQGCLEACDTNVIRRNNKEVVGDFTEAYRDCIGATRLCEHQRDCVGVLELMMICARLYRNLQGCADSSKVTP